MLSLNMNRFISIIPKRHPELQVEEAALYDCNQYPVRKLIQVNGQIVVLYLYKWPVN